MSDFQYKYQPQKKKSVSLKQKLTSPFASLLNRLNIPQPLRDKGVLLIAGIWFVAIIYVATTGITGYLSTTSNLTTQLNETSLELTKLQVEHSTMASEFTTCQQEVESCQEAESTCQVNLVTCNKFRDSLESQVGNMSAMEVENAELRNELDEKEEEIESLINSYVQTVCCLQQKANPDVRYYKVVKGWITCTTDSDDEEFSC